MQKRKMVEVNCAYCGELFTARADHINSGAQKSCGCLRRASMAAIGKKNKTHGHWVGNAPSLTYKSWKSMIDRCTLKCHQSWRYYGGKGISVCKRWLKFENFLADMGERPGENFWVGRKDHDKNYSPSNVRWEKVTQRSR